MSFAPLSSDGQVIALACAALSPEQRSDVRPLSASEWQALAEKIGDSAVARPSNLTGLTPRELEEQLQLAPPEAERLARLLSRGGQMAFELDRLAGRGIWMLTRADDAYPRQLKRKLGRGAPPILYGSGSQELLQRQALAIVGSRDADDLALSFARELARRSAAEAVVVVSGAARGVDAEAMESAIAAGGLAIGVTVDPLERLVRRPALRSPIGDGALTLITPFHPQTRWHAGNAMRRNRIIYAMSAAAAVAASAHGSGGTWTGAIENLRHGWVPLFVRAATNPGASALADAGAAPLRDEDLLSVSVRLLLEQPSASTRMPHQPRLDEGVEVEVGASAGSPDVGEQAQEASGNGELAADAFEAIWPLLSRYLQSPRSEREVTEALKLQPGQTRVWLQRAVAEKLVTVRKRPRKLYLASDAGKAQLKLA